MKISKLWISFQTHETYELNHPFLWFLNCISIISFHSLSKQLLLQSLQYYMSVTFIHYPWGFAANIWKNNAYKISYIREKKKVTIIERRRNGDWIALNGHWMVTEMYLPFSRLNGDWKVTEWRLSVFTEWWRFVLWTPFDQIYVEVILFTLTFVSFISIIFIFVPKQ